MLTIRRTTSAGKGWSNHGEDGEDVDDEVVSPNLPIERRSLRSHPSLGQLLQGSNILF